jgi:hypothetical protein
MLLPVTVIPKNTPSAPAGADRSDRVSWRTPHRVPAKIPKPGSAHCVTSTRIRQPGSGSIGSGLDGNVLRSCIARTAPARCGTGASSVENRNGLVAPDTDIISDPLAKGADMYRLGKLEGSEIGRFSPIPRSLRSKSSEASGG